MMSKRTFQELSVREKFKYKLIEMIIGFCFAAVLTRTIGGCDMLGTANVFITMTLGGYCYYRIITKTILK